MGSTGHGRRPSPVVPQEETLRQVCRGTSCPGRLRGHTVHPRRARCRTQTQTSASDIHHVPVERLHADGAG